MLSEVVVLLLFIVITAGGVPILVVKIIPVLSTDKEFSEIAGTLEIVVLLKPVGIITFSPDSGTEFPDQLSEFVHLSFVPLPVQVLFVCPHKAAEAKIKATAVTNIL